MENKFCVSCGQQLEAGAKFCPHCGASQPVEQNQQPQAGTTQQQAPQMQQQPTQAQPAQPQTPPVQPQAQQQTPPVQPTPQQGYQQNGYQQAGQQGQFQKHVNDFKKYRNTVPGQGGTQPKLGFLDSVKYMAANTFDFKTPETRKAVFWWGVLGGGIVTTILEILKQIMALVAVSSLSEFLAILTYIIMIIAGIFDLLYGISFLSGMVRRIRYITNNPWLVLVPFYNLYLMLLDYPQYNPQMYQQNQMQQPGQYQQYQQQNMNQMPNMNQAPNQMPQQPVQNQQPVQQNNNDQNTPQN